MCPGALGPLAPPAPVKHGTARGHEVCLGLGMTLPHPREAETGELPPRRPEPRIAFDVETRVLEAIAARGSTVEIFGARYRLDDAAAAQSLAELYRNAVLVRFNERVAAPDESVWRLFSDQVHDQLQNHPELDASVLQMLQLTIDNL